MELKTKYQYTYFIYPYLVDQKKYDKYLLKLLNNSNCKIKEFESQKDADLYSYFLPKVRDMLFWSMDYTKNKTEKLRKMESGMQGTLLAQYPCVIFEYNLKKDIQGKAGKKDGIFFNITKIEIICFNTGICFLNIKAVLDGESNLANLCNFNYKFRDIKSNIYNFGGYDNIKIQTDMFDEITDIAKLIKDITGNNYKANLLNLDTQRFITYSFACIDQECWNDRTNKEIFEKEFLKFAQVKRADQKMDYEENMGNLKVLEKTKYEIYGISNMGNVLVTSDINTDNYTKIPHSFERELLYTYILELYKKIYIKKINSDFRRTSKVKEVSKEFIDFTQKIWIEETTNNDFGNIMCTKWQEQLNINQLYYELKDKYDTLYKNANIESTNKTNKWILALLAILLLINIISVLKLF